MPNKKDIDYELRPIKFFDDPYYFLGKAIKIRKQRNEFENQKVKENDQLDRLRNEKYVISKQQETRIRFYETYYNNFSDEEKQKTESEIEKINYQLMGLEKKINTISNERKQTFESKYVGSRQQLKYEKRVLLAQKVAATPFKIGLKILKRIL